MNNQQRQRALFHFALSASGAVAGALRLNFTDSTRLAFTKKSMPRRAPRRQARTRNTPYFFQILARFVSNNSLSRRPARLGAETCLLPKLAEISENFKRDGASAGFPADETLLYQALHGHLTSSAEMESNIDLEACVFVRPLMRLCRTEELSLKKKTEF